VPKAVPTNSRTAIAATNTTPLFNVVIWDDVGFLTTDGMDILNCSKALPRLR
jgi:hypothetical protein